MSASLGHREHTGQADLGTLKAIEDRVLWLSAAIIDHANRGRPNRPA